MKSETCGSRYTPVLADLEILGTLLEAFVNLE